MEINRKQNWSLIIMRHAKSAHNKKKDQHKRIHNNNNTSSYKQTQSFLKTKFSKEFIDPIQIEKELIHIKFKEFDMSEISLILTSPLNRCLETVTEILSVYFKKSQSRLKAPQVIVDPCLTSRVSTAWSTGVQLNKKIQQYPCFNFQEFSQRQRHWILQILDQNIVSKYQKSNQSSESILQFVSQGNLETYENVMKRIREFKWKLKNKYLKVAKGKKILIISHNCLFQYLIGTQLNSKGKVHSEIELQHCEPLFLKDKFVLEQTYLKPENNFFCSTTNQ